MLGTEPGDKDNKIKMTQSLFSRMFLTKGIERQVN